MDMSGRAIDPEVFPVGDRLLLYFATRDPAMKVQMLGVASAPLESDFGRAHWKQLVDGPILKPELPWERHCIEAPSLLRHGDTLWMFYAGGYNNEPQQIGVATSHDGLTWSRFSDQPIVPNGPPGSWNSSESGHPVRLCRSRTAARICFSKATKTTAGAGISPNSPSSGLPGVQ